MTEKMSKAEIVTALQSHIVDSQIFAQNGVSIWAEFVMSGEMQFVVYAPGGKRICKTLDDAATVAAQQQC